MSVFLKDAENKLLAAATALKESPDGYYALHYYLSDLMDQYRSEYQIKIAINIINDLFKGEIYSLFVLRDSDLILLYQGNNRGLLEKAIFQIRYLFMDDPLAYNADGFENDDFCSVYDLEFQWRDFFVASKKKAGASVTPQEQELSAPTTAALYPTRSKPQPRAKLQFITPAHLTQIISDLRVVDISSAIRSQPVCAAVRGRDIKPLFEETYVNIAHLRGLMQLDIDIFSSKPLFKYITESLDKRVLSLLKMQPAEFFKPPMSLNLNVKTLLSEEFAAFDAMIPSKVKHSVVIEISVADIFEDIHTYLVARKAVQKLGYRILIDGLDSLSFTQINREQLGADMVKLTWNPEMKENLDTDENVKLSEAIRAANPARVILCRCDNQTAVEYGHTLGISLFQGRHFDRILDPEAKVVN